MLTASFRFRIAPDTLAVRLSVPTIRVRRGLTPPSHQSTTIADWMALTRHAPCLAHTKKPQSAKGTGAREPGYQIQSGLGPSFHGGPKTVAEWQVSWLQGHLTCRAFPEYSSGIMRLSSPLQLRVSEGFTPSSLLTVPAGHGTKSDGQTIMVWFVPD